MYFFLFNIFLFKEKVIIFSINKYFSIIFSTKTPFTKASFFNFHIIFFSSFDGIFVAGGGAYFRRKWSDNSSFQKSSPVSFLIPNLPETNYIYTVYFPMGNSSVSTEVLHVTFVSSAFAICSYYGGVGEEEEICFAEG